MLTRIVDFALSNRWLVLASLLALLLAGGYVLVRELRLRNIHSLTSALTPRRPVLSLGLESQSGAGFRCVNVQAAVVASGSAAVPPTRGLDFGRVYHYAVCPEDT